MYHQNIMLYLYLLEYSIDVHLLQVNFSAIRISSIGYPVVTLGFGFKSYVGYRMRQVSLHRSLIYLLYASYILSLRNALIMITYI